MLKEQNVDMQISEAAIAQLAHDGYDPAYGARPLRRLIQRSIENPIAIYLIDGSLKSGDTVLIDYDSTKDQFVFRKVATAPQTPPSPGQAPADQPPTGDNAAPQTENAEQQQNPTPTEGSPTPENTQPTAEAPQVPLTPEQQQLQQIALQAAQTEVDNNKPAEPADVDAEPDNNPPAA
jgi:hypothetical protein